MQKNMSYNDDNQWAEVRFDKRRPGGGTYGVSKAQAVKQAVRNGTATTEARQKMGSNKSAAFNGAKNMRKLDENTTDTKHETVSRSFSKALIQARTAKKLNQKQLAQLINEKPTVINTYEAGKAIPNGAIINKLNRALGCQLPKAKAKK